MMGKIIELSQLSGLDAVSGPAQLRMNASSAAAPNNTPDTMVTNNTQLQNSLREAFPPKQTYLPKQVFTYSQKVPIVLLLEMIDA